MTTGRRWCRSLRAALALALALALLPLPALPEPAAEAWDTGSGYRQDENGLRTIGVSAGARSVIDFAGDGSRTETRAITTSYFAGTVPDGTAPGGTSDITVNQISRAYLLLHDVASKRWIGLIAINSAGSGEIGDATTGRGWGGVRGAAFSLWGTGQKDWPSNPRSSIATALSDFPVVIAGSGAAPVTRLSTGPADNPRRYNGIATSPTGARLTADDGAATGGIGSCACDDNAFGRAAFLVTAQITGVTTATSTPTGGDTLTVSWQVAFATPQVSGPVELWTAAETFQNAAGLAARLYDGWDRYATRTIGTKPFVGITSVPSGASPGQQTQIMVEATDPESDIDAADVDIRAVSLTLVGPFGYWVTLIAYHRKADSTNPTLQQDDTFQILRDDGRYSALSDGSPLAHQWLTFDPPDRVSSGDSLRVTFRVTFKEAAAGQTFTAYARVMDREMNSSGLVRVGTIRIEALATVTFSPPAVAQGGQVSVSASGLSTSTALASVSLVDSPLTPTVTTKLGSASLVNRGFGPVAFTVPSSVAPGLYHVQATDGVVTATSESRLRITPPLPDLLILLLAAGPALPGQSVPLTLTVANAGVLSTGSDFHVHIFVDRTTPPTITDTPALMLPFGPLAAGAATSTTASLALAAGEHAIWVLADGHDAIAEVDEANNVASRIVTVPPFSTPISVGQTVTGTLETSDLRSPSRGGSYFADLYTFSAGAGQRVAIALTSSAFDAYLYLVGPSGTSGAQDDDGAGGTNPRIPPGGGFLTLPATGTYTVEVTSYSPAAVGGYALSLTGGADRDLVFVEQPVRAAHGYAFGVQPRVAILDTGGVTVTADSTTVVTLAIRAGTGASGAVLACDQTSGGVTAATVAAGVATFSGCTIDRPAAGYVLEATAAAAAPALSLPFSVAWAGDTNGDCRVSILDYSTMVTHFGKSRTSEDWATGAVPAWRGDIDGDEQVDVVDHSIVVTRFGTVASACAPPSGP